MQEPKLFHYGAIEIDVPWKYENWSKKGEWKNASRHYECMSIEEIAALHVGHYAAPDCALFMWVTDPFLDAAFGIMRGWGFRYTTVAFTWAKLTRRGNPWHMGAGYWTRANPEMVLMGTIGEPKRKSRAVRQLVVAPLREHSRKPDEVKERIEALVDGPYLELFARSRRRGWTSWGKEVDKFDGQEAKEEKESRPDRSEQGAIEAACRDTAA